MGQSRKCVKLHTEIPNGAKKTVKKLRNYFFATHGMYQEDSVHNFIYVLITQFNVR